MTPALKRFYTFVASWPCLRCQSRPVEVAHIEGIVSPKSGLLMPRSHKTLAAYSAIPLCADCHRHAPDAIERIGEEAFFDALGKSASWRFQYVASLLAQFAAGAK